MRELLEFAARHDPKTYEGLAAAAELKRREGRTARFALVVSGASLLLTSGLSIYFTSRQFRLSAQMPYKAALYTARVQSMRDYIRAYQFFDASLRQGIIDLKYNPFTPQNLLATTDGEMAENAAIARPLISAQAAYIREASAARGVWPSAIQANMIQAAQDGSVAFACFKTLGAHRQLTPEQWMDVRQRAAEDCLGADDYTRINSFKMTSDAVADAMRRSLSNMDTELVPKEE